nr:glycosyltransferase family 9 protein [bacterium]
LQVREFDLAVNLDTSPLSAGLLSLARAREKVGFDLDERGRVRPLGDAARELLETSVFDDLKRANRRTYQEIVSGILGLEPPVGGVVLNLLPAEREAGRIFAIRNGLDECRLTVGVNTGGGGRWRYKRWTETGTVELIRRLRGELDAQVVLFGGPEEEERNARILEAAGPQVIDAGCRNSLRGFFSRLAQVDILVASDTMALHAALGLGKKVAALFGPTSAWEIELYGRGERVVAPVPCQCCYLNDCEVSPNCMDSITAERVMESLVRLL